MSYNRSEQFSACMLMAAALTCGAVVADAAAGSDAVPEQAPSRWQAKISLADRGPLEGWIGYLPPSFTDDLKWIGGASDNPDFDATTFWHDRQDQVVVIQSWSVAVPASAKMLDDVVKVVEEFSEIDVQLIALHTPQSADRAEELIPRAPGRHQIVLDPTGDYCDALGIFKSPVNLVIGRNGAIRYVGLSPDGLREAIDVLLYEDPHEAPCGESRSLGLKSVATGRSKSAAFPPANTPLRGGNDLRGKTAPEFHVASWVANEPESLSGKVTVVEFWRTGCPHCINAIPHINEMAEQFQDRVNIVGITNETYDAVEQGLTRRQRSISDFKYAVASDPARTMMNAFRPPGVPNAAVIDSNWIVRWQGHPAQLTTDLLDQIVRADEANRGVSAPPPKRWLAERTTASREERLNERRQRAQKLRNERSAALGFPPIEGDTGTVNDFRGKRGPTLEVGTWMNSEPDLAGPHVTVIELFAVWCPHCRRAIPKMNEFAEQFGDRVNIVAISDETPQKFNENLAKNGLSIDSWKHPVAIDPAARVKSAVNPRGVPYALILGSDWTVRWQGHPNGITTELLDQIVRADEATRIAGPSRADTTRRTASRTATDRGAERAARDVPPGFPPITGETRATTDFRGRTGPQFQVATWVTEQPENLGESVTVIEFWRTGCPHCIRSIPHLNELAEHFGDRVNIIGVSSEQTDAFERGLVSKQVSKNDFKYYVALDPQKRLQNAVGPRGVPYAMVLGSDWTVRWQGHPSQLTEQLLEQITKADETLRGARAASR